MTLAEQREAVALNIRAYRKAWRDYDAKHGEIFNPIEQRRLRAVLERARAEVRSGAAAPLRALDLGSGTGNVTRHLVELGFDTTASDVSPDLLRVVSERLPGVRTELIDGLGLSTFADASFDLVTAYSVLHHVPDYLAMVGEAVRVLRPGGVLVIDHEASDDFWVKGGCVDAFRRAMREEQASRPGWWNPARRPWQRHLDPRELVLRFNMRFRPKAVFCVEGDLHTWAFDHVEWDSVEGRLAAAGAEVVEAEEYLVYRDEYPRRVWEEYRESCSDMRVLIARKGSQVARRGVADLEDERPVAHAAAREGRDLGEVD